SCWTPRSCAGCPPSSSPVCGRAASIAGSPCSATAPGPGPTPSTWPRRQPNEIAEVTTRGVDRLLAAAGLDPALGVQVVSGRRLASIPFDPSLPLVLLVEEEA